MARVSSQSPPWFTGSRHGLYSTNNRLQDIQDQNAIEMCTEFLEHKTDDYMYGIWYSPWWAPKNPATGRQREFVRFRYITLFKVFLRGALERGRHRGLQRKNWLDNIKQWTDHTKPDLKVHLEASGTSFVDVSTRMTHQLTPVTKLRIGCLWFKSFFMQAFPSLRVTSIFLAGCFAVT